MIDRPPEWLDAAASAHWTRLAGEASTDSQFDRDSFAIYCAGMARLAEVHGQLVSHGLIIPRRDQSGRVVGVTVLPHVREFRELAKLVLSLRGRVERRAPAIRFIRSA